MAILYSLAELSGSRGGLIKKNCFPILCINGILAEIREIEARIKEAYESMQMGRDISTLGVISAC